MSTALTKQADVREFPVEKLRSLAPSTQASTMFNRELSLLEFHRRVLDEALDETNPLLERLKFMAIFTANIDEFFMIRVSGLKEELEENVTDLSPDGMTPTEQLREIRECLLPMVELQGTCLTENVLPLLEDAGVSVVTPETLSVHERASLKQYFTERVFPLLTPLAVDRRHPFPYISPLSLNLALMVDQPDEPSSDHFPKPKLESRFVRIKVPSVTPRLLPVGFSNSKFILLEDLIEANIQSLFPGMKPGSCHRFRVTRDADIEIREEEAEDLLVHLQRELRKRRFGSPVRLEVSASMPQEMRSYLLESLS